jgi:hypothetical protein
LQEIVKPFKDWTDGIDAQNKLAQPKRWWQKKLCDNVVTDGPYAEIKEAVTGTILIHANDYDGAAEITNSCS